METNIVLVVLVGLPGSGKTTLCQSLKSYQENQGGGKLKTIHLCYDDLIPLSVQREFVKQKRTGEEENDWKGIGDEVRNYNKDGRNTEEDKDHEQDTKESHDIGEDWKTARRKIHTQVDQFLQYVITGKADSEIKQFFGIPLKELEDGSKYVFLLDDNFYYRSMRYEYFQLARRHSTAFCQLYLECSTEEAVLHNELRDERVPTDAVTAMGERLQCPQPHLHLWEANTCVLKRGEVSEAWDVVMRSFHHALTPLQDRTQEVAEARRCCSQSVLHQADLSLRAIVKRMVKEQLRGSNERSTASQVAGGINAARQTVLARLRAGEEVPLHLADAVTLDNREEFETFLEAQMKRILSQ